MRRQFRLFTLLFGVVCIAAAATEFSSRTTSAAGASSVKVVPPPSGIYHSAFPDFGGAENRVSAARLSAFTTLAGKPLTWAYFSQNWMDGIKFPAASVATIRANGSIPFIRMMPRSTWNEGGPDPVYSLQNIANGQFDAALAQWARDARDSRQPLMVEFGTEVNGDWFPWNGRWNGGAAGPALFQASYRHIVDIFRAQGANNITWVFHVDAQPSPATRWNTMAAYYPGDDYIDWIGVSVYGPQEPGEDWQTFTEVLDSAYAELAAISPAKPLALLEFGVTEGIPGHDKAAWISDALAAIKGGRYPRLKAVSYWHEKWRNDNGSVSNLRIDSSPAALAAYRQGVADPVFVTGATVAGAATAPQPTATATASPPTRTPTQAPTATPYQSVNTPVATPTRIPTATPTPAPATPTPTAGTVPVSAAAGFSEDFESPPIGAGWVDGSVHGAWQSRFNGYGSVGIEDAGGHVLGLNPRAPTAPGETHSSLVTTNQSFGDLDMTVRVRTLNQSRTGSAANPWETAWLLWHFTDNTHFYYIVPKTNGFELGKEDPAYPGAQRFLVTSSNRTFAAGSWYTIRVRQAGNAISVWIDGSLMATFTDNERPYKSGAIGLYAEDSHAQFDNVSVTAAY